MKKYVSASSEQYEQYQNRLNVGHGMLDWRMYTKIQTTSDVTEFMSTQLASGPGALRTLKWH